MSAIANSVPVSSSRTIRGSSTTRHRARPRSAAQDARADMAQTWKGYPSN
jgi:hypothetical protein